MHTRYQDLIFPENKFHARSASYPQSSCAGLFTALPESLSLSVYHAWLVVSVTANLGMYTVPGSGSHTLGTGLRRPYRGYR